MGIRAAKLGFLIASFVACGSSNDANVGQTSAGGSVATGGGGADASATGGTGGGLPIIDAGGGAATCPWLIETSDAGSGIEPFCQELPPSTALCPIAPPDPGSACTMNDLKCFYREGGDLLEFRCENVWSAVAHRCSYECTEPDAGTTIAIDTPCGNETLACDGNPERTYLEMLENDIRKFASCCGPLNESTLTLRFDHGCPVSVSYSGSGGTAFVDCVANSLRGKRIDCAAALPCAEVLWSTLQ